MDPLRSYFKHSKLLLLDGGLATELEDRGYDLKDSLWSARLLIDNPEAIKAVHRDYLEAGADCIISASYQGTIEGFMNKGLSEKQASDLLQLSVQLAMDARDEFWASREHYVDRLRPLVAASIGPYGAALADGSEYTGDYELDEAGLYHFHKRRFQILAATKADILAVETIPSYAESRALARLLQETPGRYAWFSFSCRDGKHINDGTPIASCARELVDLEQVSAIGVNCTAPTFIPSLVSELRNISNKPILVYPNSGEKYDIETRRWHGTVDSKQFARASVGWSKEGASILGGCCRTGPDHIRLMKELLKK